MNVDQSSLFGASASALKPWQRPLAAPDENAPGVDQSSLFGASASALKPWQRPLAAPDENAPGAAHRDARPTEKAAAELVAPRTGTARRKVLMAIAQAGDDGLTDWEIHVVTSVRLYTAAPRRNELLRAGWIVDSGRTRPTDSGAAASVWTLSKRGKEELGL